MTSAAPSRRVLVWVWVVFALTLGPMLALAQTNAGPIDDPDPARQRPGFLDAFELPAPAPRVDSTIPTAGRRAVAFFERRDRLAELCAALDGSELTEEADIAVIVTDPAPEVGCGGVTVVPDPSGEIAGSFELRQPAGGGPPVGYAIIDRDRLIRYRTVDPSARDELSEVRTILAATP